VIAATLLLYATVLALAAPRALSGTWTVRQPRAALLAWHVVIGTVVASIGASALLAAHDAWEPLASRIVGNGPGTHPGVASAVLGHEWNASLLVVFALGVRILLMAVSRVRATRAERAHLRAAVATLSPRPLPAPFADVSVIGLPEPTAFCLPGRRPQIVVSEKALNFLNAEQLQAVICHERAHLSHRHASTATWAAVLADAFPRWALVTAYAREVPKLHEMRADDRAAEATDGRVVTASLLALSSPTSSGALAMSGGNVAVRAARLLQPPRPSRGPLTGVGVVLSAILAVPVLLFTGPGLSSVFSTHHADHGHVTTNQSI
jgi:Zn-dependent protease with chaperone function